MIDGKLAREAAALVGFAQLDVGAIFLVLDGELCEARTRRADGGALTSEDEQLAALPSPARYAQAEQRIRRGGRRLMPARRRRCRRACIRGRLGRVPWGWREREHHGCGRRRRRRPWL